MKILKTPTVSPEIRAEQIRTVYKNQHEILPILFFSVFATWGAFYYSNSNNVTLAMWAGCFIIYRLFFLLLIKNFIQKNLTVNDILRWGNHAIILAFFSGLFWAAAPLLFIDEQSPITISTAICTICVAGGLGAAYYGLLSGFIAFSIPVYLSLSVALFQLGEEYLILSLISLICPILHKNISSKYERSFIESTQIRLEKQQLIEELKLQKQEAEYQKQQAEQANVAKSKFLAAASHDVRQPLHALSLYLDTLEQELTSERQQALSGKMRIATTALGDLFECLLDISKLDAGVVEPNRIDHSIRDLFMQLDVRFSPTAHEKNLTLKFEHENEVIFTDPALLERILDNLISNAIQYTESGTITVLCSQQDEHVSIKVSDTGYGVPEDEQQNIFNEFYQLQNPERDRSKGLGLGLSIVKRLTDLLNIPLVIESSSCHGTTFSLELTPGDPYQIQSSKPIALTGNWDLKHLRTLFIDDEADVRDAMHGLMRSWGCEIRCVESADTALTLINKGFYPDLVIADYRLRESKTGVEAIRIVTKRLNRKIPSLLITGDTSPERLLELTQSGFKTLHKPINPSQLRIVINHLLARSHLGHEGSDPAAAPA